MSNKNLVICCDGTWNRLDAQHPTNVVKLAVNVLPQAQDGRSQIVFYDEGVGTGTGPLHWASNVIEGAIGAGLDANIQDAYRFLIFNYSPGDRIYIIGFSRGAYTARSLAGLIRKCGILPRKHAQAAGDAMAFYRRRDAKPLPLDAHLAASLVPQTEEKYKEAEQFLREHECLRPEIDFLGVWDTVGALGVPPKFRFAQFLNKGNQFHDTDLSRLVKYACHAVSIDDMRVAFKPALWSPDSMAGRFTVFQEWFPGVHTNVGGGNELRGLSDGAFAWMVGHAQAVGLEVAPEVLKPPRLEPDDMDPIDRRVRHGAADVAGWAYLTVGKKWREIPADAVYSRFARDKWRDDRSYRPANVDKARIEG